MFPLRTFLGNNSRCLVQRSFATSAQRYRIRNEPSYLDKCYVQRKVLLKQNTTSLKLNIYYSSTAVLKDTLNENIDRASTTEVKGNDILDNINSDLFDFDKDTPGENIQRVASKNTSDELVEKANIETTENVTFRAGDWICNGCQYHNFSHRKYCYKCNTSQNGEMKDKKIGLKDTSQPRPGDWKCNSCGFNNFAHRKICFKCNKPESSNLETTEDSNSNIEIVNQKNSDWYCYDCNVLNFARRTSCFKCNASKTAMMQLSKPQNHSTREGDWICPQCQFINFARRSVCMKCRSEKNLES